MKLLWTKNPKQATTPRAVHDNAEDHDIVRDPRHQSVVGAAAEPFPFVPFHLATCTLLQTASDAEQAAFSAHLRAHPTRDAFWEHAPVADWMLDLLRSEWHWIRVVPEVPLRTFARECVVALNGADAPWLAELKAAVQRRIAGSATTGELQAVQAKTQALVTPGGVQGLPRCSPHAAGALASWHTANPNPYEAAFWAAEFAALHDAFLALRGGAEAWNPAAEPSAGWRVAFFARAHPHVRERALREARERQAGRLKAILPQPFAGIAAVARRPS